MNRNFDLEPRLIRFTSSVLDLVEKLPKTYVGTTIGKQITRSCISPALNYGEAQAAESRSNFVHKMKVCLKELRETQVCLKIIQTRKLVSDEFLGTCLSENAQLVAIFTKSVQTAKNKSGTR